jgi:hypothetical protein
LSRTGPLLCTTINRNQREGDKEAQDPQEDGERAKDFSTTFISVVAGLVAGVVAGVLAGVVAGLVADFSPLSCGNPSRGRESEEWTKSEAVAAPFILSSSAFSSLTF